jgi:small subunit ribosomal protein S3
MAIEKVIKAGAKGVKVTMSGRLNGAEIARTETLAQGKVPLHTLRANIDFSRATAFTTYGAVGIKVWIYKGEIFK